MGQLLGTCGHGGLAHSPHAPLDEQFNINGAGFVTAETKAKGVLQIVEFEMIGAPRIGPIEKRAVIGTVTHRK